MFEQDFFQNLSEIVVSASESNQKMLIMGDFNAKIGDSRSEFGDIEDFVFLRPDQSAKSVLDHHGKLLLESMSSGDFMLVPQVDDSGKYPITCKANANRASVSGGSVIDFMFASLPLVEYLGNSSFAFEKEISSHAWLEVYVNIPTTDTGVIATSSAPPQRTVMSFDLDRVLEFEHGEDLLELVNNPSDFTVNEAYGTIMNFVGGYTVTEVRAADSQPKVDQLDKRLQSLRARTRQIERKLRKAKNPEVVKLLQDKLQQALDLWKTEREAVRQEKLTRVRERFHEARRNGQFHLAWKLARMNLGGKGGGVRTSVTTAIDRQGWENHFAAVFQGTGSGAGLMAFDPGGRRNEVFDDPILPHEVEEALERKKNMKAPGPDGFRVDFLRFVRYDEVVCRALANFFNLVLRTGEIPSTWDSAFLFVLYKGKGDRADPNSYRGITLKSHFLKLLEAIMCRRFLNWAESNNLLPEEQLAYRHGLSGTDHLFILNILKEVSIESNRPLFVSLVDLRKAFPSVDRERLLRDLRDAGTSAQFVTLVRRLYSEDKFQLLLDGVPGHAVFFVECGVHEGSCLSPAFFIFFIRGLVEVLACSATNIDCPLLGGRKLFSMIYADDVTLFTYSNQGTQQLVDATVAFFTSKGLIPNPGKCEFIVFERRRTRRQKAKWQVMGVDREEQESARYLGLFFESDGKWNLQLQTTLSRARIALGRCKIIANTVGYSNFSILINYFDATVASVYRFGLGVWGVSVAKINGLDELFADYVRYIFRFPRTTGTNVILSNFARRCAKCDSLFLAAVQLATWRTTRNTLWSSMVEDLRSGRVSVSWFEIVKAELIKRGFESEVFEHGESFLAERKRKAVEFSQYCYQFHLNVPNGSSADQLRRVRPFGILPLLLSHGVYNTRFIFSFLCASWRFMDRAVCEWYPDVCTQCDRENSSFHLLFECVKFAPLRSSIFEPVGIRAFDFDVLCSESRPVQLAVISFGKSLFYAIRDGNPAASHRLDRVQSQEEDSDPDY